MNLITRLPLGRLTKCVIANPNISNSGGRVLIVFRRVSTDGVTSAKLLTYEEPGFRNTPTKQLVRAAVVLKLSSFDFLVKHADTLFKLGRSLLGGKLFGNLMTATFYGQFCPGQTYEDIHEATYAMREAGIIPLLAVPTEEDSKLAVGMYGDVESWYKENTRRTIECIDIGSRFGIQGFPRFLQIKLTALIDQELCEKLGQVISENNGDDEEILASISTFDKEYVQLDMLSKEENLHLNESLARFEEICKHGSKCGVHLYVDAEYISINPALYLLSKAMMLRHNKTKPVLQVTIQAYLKSAKNETEKILKFCRDADIVFGAKIVRGAYLVAEKARAEKQGYENPICDSLEATHDNYNEIVESLLRRISRNRNGKIHVMVASHNEDSVTRVVKRLHDFGIDPMRGAVVFAQLYGLSDHVTNWLGANNYPVYKSTPCGSVEETMPYLYRRAQENNSLTKGDKRDRTLINMELSKRLRQLILGLGNGRKENVQ